MNKIEFLTPERADELIERFFDGLTTNAEEQSLYAYFCRSSLPQRHEDLREMFCYFRKGVQHEKEELLSALPAPSDTVGSVTRPRFRWLRVAAVAVVLLVGVSAVLLEVGQPEHLQPASTAHAGEDAVPEVEASGWTAYCVVNGVEVTDPALMKQYSDEALQEADALLAQVDNAEKALYEELYGGIDKKEIQAIAETDFPN